MTLWCLFVCAWQPIACAAPSSNRLFASKGFRVTILSPHVQTQEAGKVPRCVTSVCLMCPRMSFLCVMLMRQPDMALSAGASEQSIHLQIGHAMLILAFRSAAQIDHGRRKRFEVKD